MAKIVAPRLRRKCALLLIALALSGAHAPAFVETIPWRPDIRFSRTSVDDDVRSILRSLLRANGLSAIFRPGVEDPISLRFDKVPPRRAFEQLMIEQGLANQYNPETRTVTIYKDAAVNFDPPERVLIVLTHTRYPALREMLVRFELGLDGVAFDAATNTVSLKGLSDRVKEITTLFNQVEAAAAQRIESDQALIKQQQAARRDQLEADTYAEIANAKVRVIPLRFASVGETTRQFHGRSITFPGISDTLKAIT